MTYTDVILTVIAVFIMLDWLQDTTLGRVIVHWIKKKLG
jgi:hypothetical protein